MEGQQAHPVGADGADPARQLTPDKRKGRAGIPGRPFSRSAATSAAGIIRLVARILEALPGLELRPVVTDARLKFDDFKLTRISDVRGAVAKELGELLRKELQKKLSGPKLVDRFNRALQKHPERLRLSPDMLLGKSSPKKQASSP